ncbi:MAG: decarboxylating 6-phosphogluconate dehydrogenase [Acidobacteria bacterium]|nr:decarboxylating 6-phosphogluconate dehydrogenase [Acidobacteriota bacterium]
MKLGLVGLGKMGANMVKRLRRDHHQVVVWDLDAGQVATVSGETGAVAAADLDDLCSQLDGPRIVWVMVPAGEPTQLTLEKLSERLQKGDIVLDGGNSRYKDTLTRAGMLARKGIHLLDAGTSGGIWGLEEGYCLMVGGSREAYHQVEPILRTLAPPAGYAHVGPVGAGHYTKMVHNGIEYAMMQAYGEGFELLKEGPFPLDLPGVAKLWGKGSVIRSWLLDLVAAALDKNPDLAGIEAWVADSGEGRWTVEEAIERSVAAPAITQALFARFASRRHDAFSLRLVAALRDEFGGHGTRSGGEKA